jgi:DNA-binding transcriptional ArsR family regulator
VKKTIDSQINYNEDVVERVRRDLISDQCVSKLASFFKSVGEENRVRIIYALSLNEMCVSDLAVALGVSQSLISHQLKLLKLEGQVKSRREGKNIYYSLDDEHVVEIFEEALKHIRHKIEDVEEGK